MNDSKTKEHVSAQILNFLVIQNHCRKNWLRRQLQFIDLIRARDLRFSWNVSSEVAVLWPPKQAMYIVINNSLGFESQALILFKARKAWYRGLTEPTMAKNGCLKCDWQMLLSTVMEGSLAGTNRCYRSILWQVGTQCVTIAPALVCLRTIRIGKLEILGLNCND